MMFGQCGGFDEAMKNFKFTVQSVVLWSVLRMLPGRYGALMVMADITVMGVRI